MISSDAKVFVTITLTTIALFTAWVYNILEALDILAVVCIPPVVVYEGLRFIRWFKSCLRSIGNGIDSFTVRAMVVVDEDECGDASMQRRAIAEMGRRPIEWQSIATGV